MPNTKYCFTGETKVEFGVTLKRIRALVSFGAVVAGDVGGWLMSDINLAHEGDAWVYRNARVYGDARVSGDADFLLIGPLGSRRDHLCIHADLKLGVRFTTGCFSGTELQLKEAIQQTHGDNKYAKQYRAAIKFAALVVRPAKVEVENV